MNNSALNKALREDAVTLKLIDGEPEFEKFRNNPEHRQLKIGLPYFAMLTPEGQLVWSGTDYKATRTIIKELSQINRELSESSPDADLAKDSGSYNAFVSKNDILGELEGRYYGNVMASRSAKA